MAGQYQVPPVIPGQAPGNNQVNLGALQGNVNGLVQAGSLGNQAVNPMTGVIAAGGKDALGYQNGIANSRLQDLQLQQQMQALQQMEQQYEQAQKQPGALDFLGLGISGANAITGLDQKNALMQQLQNSGSGYGYDANGNYAGWMG